VAVEADGSTLPNHREDALRDQVPNRSRASTQVLCDLFDGQQPIRLARLHPRDYALGNRVR
jgi:hypothetical protein